MQTSPVNPDELQRAKALLLRDIPLGEASFGGIAGGLIHRTEFGLPLDEPIEAAKQYLALGAPDIRAAFAKWLRPTDLVRVSQGPQPE